MLKQVPILLALALPRSRPPKVATPAYLHARSDLRRAIQLMRIPR